MLTNEMIKKLVAEKRIFIDPFNEANLMAASYTFTLGPRIKHIRAGQILDLSNNNEILDEEDIGLDGYVMQPGEFLICESQEIIRLPQDIGCKFHMRGRGSRKGIDFVGNEGFCEPGSTGGSREGRLAFVSKNQGPCPVRLVVGAPAVKATFFFVNDGQSHE